MLSKINKSDLFLFFCVVAVTGLFLTDLKRQVLSLGMIGMVATSLPIEYIFDPKRPFRKFWSALGDYFIKIYRKKSSFGFIVLFLIIQISFFLTDHQNLKALEVQFQMKLSLLAIPVAFANSPKLTRHQFHIFYAWYLLILLSTAFASLVNYSLQSDYINWLIINSKPLPVVVNHVRYSLMIVIGILIALHLLTVAEYKRDKIIRALLFITTITLIVFLHVAGVRSGLLAFYVLALCYCFYLIIKFKKYKVSFAFLGLSLFIGIICYKFVPSVNEKVTNTIKDIKKSPFFNNPEEMNMNDANLYSLTGRIYSYKVGLEIFMSNPFFGVGLGNLQSTAVKHYQDHYPLITNHLQPHNQYIRYLAALGSVGFIVFMVCFYLPLLRNRNNNLLWGHYIIISLSFMVEGTLETQLGLSITMLFLMMFWAYGKLEVSILKIA